MTDGIKVIPYGRRWGVSCDGKPGILNDLFLRDIFRDKLAYIDSVPVLVPVDCPGDGHAEEQEQVGTKLPNLVPVASKQAGRLGEKSEKRILSRASLSTSVRS